VASCIVWSLNHITNNFSPNIQFIGDEIEAFTMHTQGGGIEVVQVKAGKGSTPLSVL
jgi:hypothetical protein